MSGTNVPFPVLGPNGYIAPASSVVLVGVQADYQAAFGGDLNFATTEGGVTNPTPQGQLTTSETAIIAEGNSLFGEYVNLVDPAYSSGRMQDAIGRIYFLSRIPAAPTVVGAVTCSGLNGVVIPVGALLQALDGNNYLATASGMITNGSVILPFACAVDGPVACPPQAFTIARTIPGWDSATSSADGVLGNLVETPAEFEFRRWNSVAANAVSVNDAVQGAVLGVLNAIDAYVLDNPTGSPVTVQGVTLAANSLYVCAAGGLAQSVGNAIWLKKPPGCAYTGGTTVTVIDPNPIYSTPPSYSVSFQTAIAAETYFYVQIVSSSAVPSNGASLIDTAITNAFTGADGGTRARIGSTIYASRYYSGVAAIGAWAQIISIQIGLAGANFTGAISGTALTVSGVTGTVAIGQLLVGNGITPGTIIQSGSGTSWVVNNSQTVASEAMTGVTLSTSVTYNINQVPVLANNNIIVVE